MKKIITFMLVILFFSGSVCFAGIGNFSGTWKNIDSKTRGVTTIKISAKGSSASVHAWGSCTPVDCDWGALKAKAAPTNKLKALFKNNFSKRRMVLTLTGRNRLKAEVKTNFTDKSGRKDYTAVYQFNRSGKKPSHSKPTGGKFQGAPVSSGKSGMTRQPASPSASFQPQTSGFSTAKVQGANTGQSQKVQPGISGSSQSKIKQNIKVIYPNGGEKWKAGKRYNIRWKSAGFKSGDKVKILLKTYPPVNAGNFWVTNSARNTGMFNYKVPSNLGIREKKFKIYVMNLNGRIKDESDRFFEITQAQSGQGAVSSMSSSTQGGPKSLKIVYPNGGEELTAGTDLDIKWKSKGNISRVKIILMMEQLNVPNFKAPIILSKSAPNTGTFRYRIPQSFNSRFGLRLRVIVHDGNIKDISDGYFSIYPTVDLTPANIKIRNKKKSWTLNILKRVAIDTATAGLYTPREAISYRKSGGEISKKSKIIIEYDLFNYGTKIVRQKTWTKVTFRLRPGNDQLSYVGFSHDKIIPGRKYHYKGTFKAADMDLAPGTYLLELYVDPGHNTNEPEALRANNKKTIEFKIK
ncbi:MAG: hypothetical protein B6I22_06240 [Desulfobacteraceae bacterium 4572_123]|nr:MAG: hypothetical protein B6I22_06240 [Desulfobacteraceae bacterium 4572_123]